MKLLREIEDRIIGFVLVSLVIAAITFSFLPVLALYKFCFNYVFFGRF